MKLADATVDQVRAFLSTSVGVVVLFIGLKSPVNPTNITVACSLLGLEPAMRTKPPRDETKVDA